MNLVDFIGFSIIFSLIVWGAKKGFVRSVLSLGSLFLSLILALSLYPIVTDFLAESPIGDYVHIQVSSMVGANGQPTINEDDSTHNLPSNFQQTISTTIDQTQTSIKISLAENITALALNILSILIVFVLVKLLLWILTKAFNLVTKLPVIKSANKLLGGALGAVYGIFAIYVILTFLTLTSAMDIMQKPTELVIESGFISMMYHHNILLNFLT